MSIPLKVRFIAACFGLSCCSVGAALVSRGTLRVRQPPVPTLYELIDHFIIVPERNLLFCYIEKVACTNFNELFRRLRARYDPEMDEGYTWWRNGPDQHNITKDDLEKMLVNKTWHKAVFFRDPVERFASGYASKCAGGSDKDGSEHCEAQFGKESMSFGEAVQWIADFDAEGSGDDSNFDEHFKLMGDFCGGLDHTLQYYDTVEELDMATARGKVSELLNTVGVDPASINGFDDLFPENPDTDAFKRSKHITDTENRMEEYFPKGLAEHRRYVLMEHYRPDYKLFGKEMQSSLFLVAGSVRNKPHWPLLW